MCLVPNRAWTVFRAPACGSTSAAPRWFCWHLARARGFSDGYLLTPSTRTACLPFLMHNFLLVWNLHTFRTNSSSQRVDGWFIFSHLHLAENPFLGKKILLHVCFCLRDSPASICLMQMCAWHTSKNFHLCKVLSLF